MTPKHVIRWTFLLAVSSLTVSAQAPPARPAAGVAAPAEVADQDTFTFALTGDSIITRRLSVYKEPPFLDLVGLVRSADAAFTNLEMLFHDYETYAMNQSGGTYMRAEPSLARELVWAGFDIVSRANNHTGDYAVGAMRLTTKYAAEAGLVQAGVGESLPEAREPKFLETAKARVALLSVSSTFPDHSRAGRSRGDVPARPGLSPLRFTTTYTTTSDGLSKLRTALSEAGLGGGRGAAGTGAATGSQAAPTSLNVFGTRVVAGDTPGITTAPNKEDLDEAAAAVRSAARLADYTIVSVHSHESSGGRLVPAQFFVTFAHAMIDAGADIIAGHGPHVLRGIEIYKGKPILYSLGDFIFQNDTLLRLPSENYEQYGLASDAQVADFNQRRSAGDTRGFTADPLIWESVVARLRFNGKRLVEVALHPISLGFKKPITERGRPLLADPVLGAKILADLTRLSGPFGTRLQIRNGVGYVDLESNRGQR